VDVDSFVSDGFVSVRQAVDTGTAAACRELIWQSMARRGLRRSDPATWPPLVRIDDLDAEPFAAAGLSPALVAAYDELIGPGRWTSPVGVGRALMVRFRHRTARAPGTTSRPATRRRAHAAGMRLAPDRRAVPGPLRRSGHGH
jgi:hypothetical protein